MKGLLKRICDELLEWLYPSKCVICLEVLPFHSKDHYVCVSCRKSIPWIVSPVCLKCGRPMEKEFELNLTLCERCQFETVAYTKGIAVFSYDIIKPSISHFKFQENKTDGIGLGRIMAEYIQFRYPDFINCFDIIMPVPMYPKKEKNRGFNQSKILALELAIHTNKLYLPDNLVRIKNTIPQSQLGHEERRINLMGAFKINDESIIEDKIILLVDDIFTTGNTINACAKELLMYGAKEVYFYSLAIVARSDSKKT